MLGLLLGKRGGFLPFSLLMRCSFLLLDLRLLSRRLGPCCELLGLSGFGLCL